MKISPALFTSGKHVRVDTISYRHSMVSSRPDGWYGFEKNESCGQMGNNRNQSSSCLNESVCLPGGSFRENFPEALAKTGTRGLKASNVEDLAGVMEYC